MIDTATTAEIWPRERERERCFDLYGDTNIRD